MHQIVSVVSYLHNKDIVHRDLKVRSIIDLRWINKNAARKLAFWRQDGNQIKTLRLRFGWNCRQRNRFASCCRLSDLHGYVVSLFCPKCLSNRMQHPKFSLERATASKLTCIVLVWLCIFCKSQQCHERASLTYLNIDCAAILPSNLKRVLSIWNFLPRVNIYYLIDSMALTSGIRMGRYLRCCQTIDYLVARQRAQYPTLLRANVGALLG